MKLNFYLKKSRFVFHRDILKILSYLTYVLLSFNSVLASPSTDSKEIATLVFTMWDVRYDITYLVDLEVSVLEVLSGENISVKIDLKKLINNIYEDKIDDFKYVRWSVMGAIRQDPSGWGMYMGSYDNKASPEINIPFSRIQQKLDRIKRYYDLSNYSAETESKYEVARRESGKSIGTYELAWQGNIDGLSGQDMEGRLQNESSELELWSLQYKIDLNDFFAEPSYEVKQHGRLVLSSDGVLEIKPLKSNDKYDSS